MLTVYSHVNVKKTLIMQFEKAGSFSGLATDCCNLYQHTACDIDTGCWSVSLPVQLWYYIEMAVNIRPLARAIILVFPSQTALPVHNYDGNAVCRDIK